MGVLRSDRVSGLGGANAINGSVFFGTSAETTRNRGLIVNNTSELDIGTGDFTLECWYYKSGLGTHDDAVGNIIMETGNQNGQNGIWLADAQGKLEGRVHYGSGSWNLDITSSSSMSNDRWYHVAMTRSGSTVRIFIDGALEASGSSSSDLTTAYSNEAYVGGQGNSPGNRGIVGYVSNARISNTALYTAAFTVPSARLEKLSSTLLLCCQSPGNVLQEATGKHLEIRKVNSNDGPPMASRFVPDKGKDYGTTFADNTKFDTLTYMVPPGGTTIERSRGRAVFAGGYSGGPSPAWAATGTMTYAQIQSMGTSIDFGDLTVARWIPSSGASSTRGTFNGGATPTRNNTIDYVTIATTSNATNFGDLTTLRTYHAGFSNSTRAISGGGNDGSSNINTIDYITIASVGNATDFGDMLEAKSEIVGDCSPTRGLFMGGTVPRKTSPVDYITIATTGNEQAFGDLSTGTSSGAALSSNTRAIYAGGNRTPSDYINIIGYFTITTLGNETDFGDLITSRASVYAGTSNNIRGVIVAGFTPSPTFNLNSIEHITIATTGNANDFGDITASTRGVTATSDSHGGLSLI